MRLHALAFLSVSVLLMPSARAADFDQFAPKLPPATSSSTKIHAKEPAVSGDTKIFLHNLKGLVFLPKVNEVKSSGVEHVRGVSAPELPLLQTPKFQEEMQVYLGKPLSLHAMNQMIRTVVTFYASNDRPYVDVAVPEQDVTSGVLQVLVVEGTVEKVSVKGNRWFSDSSFRDAISLQPGDNLRSSQIAADTDFLNQNAFRSADVYLAPGTTPGTTDVTIQAQDRFPLRVYAGYEDTGNAQTGFDRYFAGFNYGDAFRLGQQVNYQYTTSGDGESIRAHSGSYVVPLPWEHHSLTIFGSYVDSKGTSPPLVGLTGHSYQISGRYSVPLPTLRAYSVTYKETASAGFDYKYNDDSLQFGGVPVPGTRYDVDQFVLAYNATETDPYGQTTASEQLFLSPGGFGGNNVDTAYAVAHGGATSDYVYNTLVLERLTKLPGDWTLVLRGTLQTSNANLVPSEQLGFGGYGSVRGYDDREVDTDEGYIFTTEVRTPAVSLGDAFGCKEFNDQLQFLGFWDYGAANNHAPLPGEPNEIPLSALGFGVRYSINQYLTLRYDYGFQLLHTGFDNDHGSRSDLGLVLSY